MKLSAIKVNPDNPRLIKDEQFKKLVQSIKDFPKMMELRPIIVDDNNIIQGGNMRFKALQELGFKDVPDAWIKQAKDFTADELREFVIKDNLPFGEWDWQILGTYWDKEQLISWGMDITGWQQPEAHEDDYEIPDEIETDIVTGDLFEIGRHGLLCGDSTKAEDVAKLLGGAKPNLMVTDPPYGVNYDPTWRHKAGINNSSRQGKVTNDDNARWLEAYTLFPGDVVYCWCASQRSAEVHADLCEAGFIPNYQIIWNKQQFTFGRGDYHWKHEPCWYFTKKGAKHNWQGSRTETTVWDITSILQSKATGDESNFHGTQKPIECMARPIRNNSAEGDDVYDPFLGSGTTMVAAHQLNRICYGMEIDSKYCQIIIDRMKKLDGTLQIKRNGAPA